jgi:hypothetical protein
MFNMMRAPGLDINGPSPSKFVVALDGGSGTISVGSNEVDTSQSLVKITGITDLSGETKINGNTEITGTTALEGDVTIGANSRSNLGIGGSVVIKGDLEL